MRPGSAPSEKKSTLVIPVEAGRLVGGRYELAHRLGMGSMGEVWLARHRTLNQRVALKLLSTSTQPWEAEDRGTATARFQFEAQIAARLSRRSRHIVRVTDHGEEGPLTYLVMELLEGLTLEAQLMRHGCMSPDRVSVILAQVASGLEQAHAEGVVHRDLKPANIFMTRDEDGGPLVKLLDFGIARMIRRHRASSAFSTAPHLVFGTPGYMSPEHANPTSQPDRHYDLWGMATVGYEALTGEMPVRGYSTDELFDNVRARRLVPIRERNPELPASFETFFERAFAERIEDRYPSAKELASAFARAAGTLGGSRNRDSPGGAPRERPVRRRIAPWAGLVLASATAAGAMAVVRIFPGGVKVEAASPAVNEAVVGETSSSGLGPARIETLAPIADGVTEASRSGQAVDPKAFAAPPVRDAPTPRAPLGGRSRCVRPYEIDDAGFKRWKRECL